MLLLASLALLLPLASACGECGGGGDGAESFVEPGTYRAFLGTGGAGGGSWQPPPSNFPHAGKDVVIEVDRDKGEVYARWTNDAGEQVVETWEIVP